MLKLLKIKTHLPLKNIIVIALIVLCFSSIAFCLYKVIYALLTKQTTQTSSKWASKNYTKPYIPKTYFTKGTFFLTLDDFSPIHPQSELIEGEKYFILKVLEHEENSINCLYGFFQLNKKSAHQLNFKSLNQFNGKKFEQYSLLTSRKVKYRVLQKNQLSEHLLNCKNWLHIDNTMKLADESTEYTKQVNMKYAHSKCSVIPASHLFSVQSDNPNIAYFDYDYIANKLKLCVQKTGSVFVRYMTVNSTKYEVQKLKIH